MLERPWDQPARAHRTVSRPAHEGLLFLRRWLAHPLRMGTMLPSSAAMGRLVAQALPEPAGRFVLELGAGTGAISQALARRMPQEQLLLVEVDDELCHWLCRRFPRATTLCGDALDLARLAPGAAVQQGVCAVVSGIPVIRFPLAAQRAFVDQCFALMDRDGCLLQYSYSPVPPLPCRPLGLERTRLGIVCSTLLPMFLWRFTRADRG